MHGQKNIKLLLPEMIFYVFVIKSFPINMDCIYAAMYVFLFPLNSLLGTERHTSWLVIHYGTLNKHTDTRVS